MPAQKHTATHIARKIKRQAWQLLHLHGVKALPVVDRTRIKAVLDNARARVEDLQKRLFGRKSEKSQGGSEKRSAEPDIKRPRGQ